MPIAAVTRPKRLMVPFPSRFHLRSNCVRRPLYNRRGCLSPHTLAVTAHAVPESFERWSRSFRLGSTLPVLLGSLIHSTLLQPKRHSRRQISTAKSTPTWPSSPTMSSTAAAPPPATSTSPHSSPPRSRSEEHTSELQSPMYLV